MCCSGVGVRKLPLFPPGGLLAWSPRRLSESEDWLLTLLPAERDPLLLPEEGTVWRRGLPGRLGSVTLLVLSRVCRWW